MASNLALSFSHPSKFKKSSITKLQQKRPLTVAEVLELREQFRHLNSDYYVLLGQFESDSAKLNAFAENGFRDAKQFFFQMESHSDDLMEMIEKRVNGLAREKRLDPSSQSIEEHQRFEVLFVLFQEKLAKLTGLRQQFEGPSFSGYDLKVEYSVIGNSLVALKTGLGKAKGPGGKSKTQSKPVTSTPVIQSQVTDSEVFFPGLKRPQRVAPKPSATSSPSLSRPAISLTINPKLEKESSSDLSSPASSPASSVLSRPASSSPALSTSPAPITSNANGPFAGNSLTQGRQVKSPVVCRKRTYSALSDSVSEASGDDGEFKLGRGAQKLSSSPSKVNYFPTERRRSSRFIPVKSTTKEIPKTKPVKRLKIAPKMAQFQRLGAQSEHILSDSSQGIWGDFYHSAASQSEPSSEGKFSILAPPLLNQPESKHMVEVLEQVVGEGFEKLKRRRDINGEAVMEVSQLQELCNDRFAQFASQLLLKDKKILDLQKRLDSAEAKLHVPDKKAHLKASKLDDKLKETEKLMKHSHLQNAKHGHNIVLLEFENQGLRDSNDTLLAINEDLRASKKALAKELAEKGKLYDPSGKYEEGGAIEGEKRGWFSDSDTEDEEERLVKRR